MTLQLVDTPLGPAPAWPTPRAGGWNPALNDAIYPAAGLEPTLERLAKPAALVVTTGQQPGWLTGPLYTIHKALSARALARLLERRWNRPVVPVFWVAGDDHDFAEASTASWIGTDGLVMTDSLPPRAPDAPLTPMYREPVPADVAERLAALAQAFPASEARDQTIGWLARHYRAGASMAAAFGGAIAELLAPLGIVCLDSAHPSVKRAAAPLILESIRRSDALSRILTERAAGLEREGIDTAVSVGGGATLAFLEGAAGRDRIVRDAAGLLTRRGQERLSDADLERIVRDEPERLSPNVLLRPVVEAAVLPTVAYLAGPAELRYLALAGALYAPLGVIGQLPEPRWSGAIVEPKVSRALEKFGVSLPDLLDPKVDLESRIAQAGLPASLTEAFATLRAGIETGYERVSAEISRVDPTLERTAAGARGNALNGLAELEKRVTQAQKRKESESIAQISRARAVVLPRGEPQERVLAVVSFLGRYGFAMIEELAAHVDSWYANALEGGPKTV
ncbi:MAG: bacillithiol biosynthesis cysteine-adding enzyme BshC [Gemmatimonadota bacterium]